MNSTNTPNRQQILFVEPARGLRYHTPYPPLDHLKLAAYDKKRRHKVKFVHGLSDFVYVAKPSGYLIAKS